MVTQAAKPLHISITNKSEKDEEVNLFAINHNNSKNVLIEIPGGGKYEELLEQLDTGRLKEDIGQMRIRFENIWDATKVIQVGHVDANDRSVSWPLCPLLYMSPYQYCSDIVNVNPFQNTLIKGFEMISMLRHNEKRDITFYFSKDKKLEKYGTFMPILIENISDSPQKVSLFDISVLSSSNKLSTELPVDITAPASSYERILNSIKYNKQYFNDWVRKFNRIKILSDNINQIESQFQLGNSLISPLVNPYAFSTKVIDIKIPTYQWDEDNFVKLTIEPKTKVFYLFYETLDNVEDRRMDFKAEHGETLNELRLKLVPMD